MRQSKLRRILLGLRRHKLTVLACTCATGITGFKSWSNRTVHVPNHSANHAYWKTQADTEININSIPNRKAQISALQKHASSSDAEYDILIVGGGATGAGIAIDAATRGLSVAMVDCNDFASGTSSRSTKLIHGGVRYLERAITRLDRESWNLVKEAILERRHLINLSPHLSYALPIIIPVYDEYFVRGWYKLCKNYIGMKIYEAMAGRDGLLCPTYYLPSAHAKNIFPRLKQTDLMGSIVYYDGLHNDSRMCLAIAMTAAYYGANVANYVEVVDLIKDSDDKVIGARLRDNLSGKEWNTRSKVVINATGCGADTLRRKDRANGVLPANERLIVPSRGSHCILPGTFSSKDYGMLIPETSDGRVAFLLPFEGVTITGTTDVAMQHKDIPVSQDIQLVEPGEQEVNDILAEINNYLDIPVSASDVDAVWSGIRPLAATPSGYSHRVINNTVNVIEPTTSTTTTATTDDSAADTSKISRHHLIEVSNSGLVTICGGKWTTYRQMAQDCVDIVCEYHPEIGRRATECVSRIVRTIGAANWTHCVPAILERHEIPSVIAEHLSRSYGDKAFIVGNLYLGKYGKRLAGGYPYTEAEVVYCSEYEMAQTPIDILSRRTRLAQLNKAAAEYALPRVIKLMGEVHSWNVRDRVMHYHDTMQFLRTMHVKDRHKWGRSRHTLDYARRVVETVLNGPSMTDEAIQFVIDRFWDYHSQNTLLLLHDKEQADTQEVEGMQSMEDERKRLKRLEEEHQQSRQLFEGCISREQCLQLANEFSEIFGESRVVDSLMFTGLEQFGLYEILVSCAACASHRELFDSSSVVYHDQ